MYKQNPNQFYLNICSNVSDCTLIAPSTKDAPNLKGIVTHSSGNHGQAVAYACSQEVANVPCVVVVPKNTPSVKCEAIR